MHAIALLRRCFSGDQLFGGAFQELVKLLEAGVDVGGLFARLLRLDDERLGTIRSIARCL